MEGGVVKKMIVARLLVLLATLVALNTASTFVSQAFAQERDGTGEYTTDSQKNVVRNMMRAAAARNVNQVSGYGSESAVGQLLQLPPLPGEQGAFDSAKSDDSKRYFPGQEIIPDLGKNNRSSVNMVLPPLKGFQQLSDSEELKNMFKEMTVAKVPVLFQTYMMVENGAATGYMGSLNAVSNIMSNTMQTQQYQLKLLELTDDTGKMKEAYIQKIRESGQKTKGWPAALYAAVGDSADFKAVQSEGMQFEQKARAYDLKNLPSENGPGKGGKRLLSDLLFMKSENNTADAAAGDNTNTYANSQELFPKLKEEFKRLVGDVEIELAPPTGAANEEQGPDGWLRVLNMNLKAPEKRPGAAPGEELRGVALENWSEVQVVWENIHVILKEYCDFKKNSGNFDKEPGEKDTAATFGIGKSDDPMRDPWELSSAPDIPLTMSLIEQLFTLVEGSERPENVDCETLAKKRDHIPNTRKAGSEKNFDDCGDNQGCQRNRLILHLSYIIARSRTLHTYRLMYIEAKKFATDSVLNDLVDQLFVRTLAGMNIDDQLHRNREAWVSFVRYLATYLETRARSGSNPLPYQASSTSAGSVQSGGVAAQ